VLLDLFRVLRPRFSFGVRQRAVGFDLASIGEVQFLRDVLVRYAAQFPQDTIWMFHHDDTVADFDVAIPALKGRIIHVPYKRIRERKFEWLDFYVTTEQFTVGPAGVYTATLFHGQPAKGLTFLLPAKLSRIVRDVLEINDALFLYGPLQRQVLHEHLEIQGMMLPPHLSLFDIGYAKSDALLSGRFDRESYLERLGLDPAKRTILYAPAFNQGASMRE